VRHRSTYHSKYQSVSHHRDSKRLLIALPQTIPFRPATFHDILLPARTLPYGRFPHVFRWRIMIHCSAHLVFVLYMFNFFFLWYAAYWIRLRFGTRVLDEGEFYTRAETMTRRGWWSRSVIAMAAMRRCERMSVLKTDSASG
jgi:hypothetical protein